jgi:hypothetical protein
LSNNFLLPLALAGMLLATTGCNNVRPASSSPAASAETSQEAAVKKPPPSTSTPPAPAQAPELAFWTPRGGPALLARRTGRLAVEDGCVVLVSREEKRTLPVFPRGKASWDTAGGVLTYAGTRYRLGDEVTFPGGHIARDADELTRSPSEVPECGEAELFLVN